MKNILLIPEDLFSKQMKYVFVEKKQHKDAKPPSTQSSMDK
jgi:hypothetical protein